MNTRKAGSQRPYTAGEFLDIIKKIAEEKKVEFLDQLDYIISGNYSGTEIKTDEFTVQSVTDFGCNEGIYSDFYLKRGYEKIQIFTAKTLSESPEAFIKMHILAANLCLIAREYLRTHQDEFNWTGFDIFYLKEDKWIPSYWCSTKERAATKAKEMSKNGYSVLIRDNETRKTVFRLLESTHKGQLIFENEKGCFFYLYNEDGEIEEYSAKDLEDAKLKIDSRIESEGGLYNADGEFSNDW